MLLRSLPVACASQEFPDAEATVGDERAHPEFLGERERVAVVSLSFLRGIAAGRDLPKEPESPCLPAALTTLTGKGQGSPSECESVLEPVGEHVRLAQVHQEERLVSSVSHRFIGAQRLLQQRDALSNSPQERVRVPQAPRAEC